MSAAIQVTIDRDDPQFEDQREKQRETRDALIMEIYCCLAFVRSLSGVGVGKCLWQGLAMECFLTKPKS